MHLFIGRLGRGRKEVGARGSGGRFVVQTSFFSKKVLTRKAGRAYNPLTPDGAPLSASLVLH
jgi:hypothetical protein